MMSFTVEGLMLHLRWEIKTPAELNVRSTAAEDAGMQNTFFADFDVW